MPLLNYTTSIDVDKSVSEVQAKLALAGARSVMVEYDDTGNPVGLKFAIQTDFAQLTPFSLPCNVDEVHRTLSLQHQAGKVQRRFATKEQAAKVAWRILKDWMEAQLAIVETKMVRLEQVMLPYMVVQNGATMYEHVLEQGLKALGAGDVDE